MILGLIILFIAGCMLWFVYRSLASTWLIYRSPANTPIPQAPEIPPPAPPAPAQEPTPPAPPAPPARPRVRLPPGIRTEVFANEAGGPTLQRFEFFRHEDGTWHPTTQLGPILGDAEVEALLATSAASPVSNAEMRTSITTYLTEEMVRQTREMNDYMQEVVRDHMARTSLFTGALLTQERGRLQALREEERARARVLRQTVKKPESPKPAEPQEDVKSKMDRLLDDDDVV